MDIELEELKTKSRYSTINCACPQCSEYPLEYEVFIDGKMVFCSNCDYEEMVEL